MLRPTEIFESVTRLIHQLSGARSVSLYLPQSETQPRPMLLHAGDGEPLPELDGLDNAEALHRRCADGADDRLARLPSREAGGLLVRLYAASVGGPPADEVPVLWIGFRRPRGSGSRLLGEAHEVDLEAAESALLALVAELVGSGQEVAALLCDPLTVLPGRAAFQATLCLAVEDADRRNGDLSLLLVNPRDMLTLNERLGWEVGDAILREVADRLAATTGSKRSLYRYGGAVFALILPQTALRSAIERGDELLSVLDHQKYLGEDLRLELSVGVSTLGGGGSVSDRALGLVRDADRALTRAKRAGGNRLEFSRPGSQDDSTALDRLSGIFTAEAAKDYRNMLLLWDTVSILAECEEPHELADRVVSRLSSVFRPARVALFERKESGALELLAERRVADAQPAPGSVGPSASPGEALAAVIEAAEKTGAASGHRTADGSQFVIPLATRGRILGYLCVETDGLSATLGSAEEILLGGLGRQIASAIDRAELATAERGRQDREREQLRSQLSDLRQALMHSKLLFRSRQMEALLESVRRIAPSDATVLITGESGTGKELLARTVHRLSPRREVEPVVVDCGAIAASLIDSELFGRERGAYTGAERSSPGRLAEADGGTVILDEIGELPLEVQSKLLRFVQEKQCTPVGGTQAVTVDARVIAVTNRELAAELAAGRFREDLYYRLNVVRLRVPALRERPEDILFLAEVFRQRFATQYQKAVSGFHPESEELMLAHEWPGNVRELQNRVMQAVLLCRGGRITPADIGLPGSQGGLIPPGNGEVRAADRPRPPMPAQPVPDEPLPEGSVLAVSVPEETVPAAAAPADTIRPGGDSTPAAEPGNNGMPLEEAWDALRAALTRQVEAAARDETRRYLPLGRWLSEDLVLAANRESEGVLSHGADRLGIPETTFRRRLHKASAQERAGLLSRSASWQDVGACLGRLVRAEHPEGTDVLRRARDLLLGEVVSRLPTKSSEGATLMGVTEPTFQRWTARLLRS